MYIIRCLSANTNRTLIRDGPNSYKIDFENSNSISKIVLYTANI